MPKPVSEPSPPDPLLSEADAALREFRRLAARFAAFRRGPGETERVALIDDLQAAAGRLGAARDAVRGRLQRSGAARDALSAYRRIGALPRRS